MFELSICLKKLNIQPHHYIFEIKYFIQLNFFHSNCPISANVK